jgi:arsenate reductase (thioredoxin)
MTAKKLILPLQKCIDKLKNEFDQIPEERKKILKPLTEYIRERTESGKPVNLNFICTHNSRRSHISQMWAKAAAHYYNIENVNCFSGGTEVTSFNSKAVNALERMGFQIKTGEGNNPIYEVTYANGNSLKAWSKKFDDESSPASDFAAVMVCSDPDENCPHIPGARRIKVNFNDPKEFDDTPLEEQMYEERTKEIGRELLYAFSQVKKN